LVESAGPFNPLERMPRLEQQILLGRAMGRALAHELGHYLLASKAHSARGLMQGRRTTAELFATERVRFQLEAEQRSALAVRLSAPLVVRSAGGRLTSGS